MRKLLKEKTDCYRLFHGAVEGCPGLTVDRYSTVRIRYRVIPSPSLTGGRFLTGSGDTVQQFVKLVLPVNCHAGMIRYDTRSI